MGYFGYTIVPEMDHVVVYKDGKFQFTADTTHEAMEFIREELNF